jgi:hypothetical protein
MKPNTIELPKRLLDAASTEKTRECLHGALIDAENRCVAVCNGRILVTHPIPGDAPVKPGYITPEKMKMAKAKNTKALTLDFVAGTLNGLPLDEPDVNGNFPNYRQVIPIFAPCYRTAFKPTLLAALAASMGYADGKHDALTFEFDTAEHTAIRVSYKGVSGVLMPVNGAGDNGLLVASGESTDTLRQEIANLKTALSEHSDLSPASAAAVATSAADAALIDTLKSALFERQARVKQLEAYIDGLPAATAAATPAVKPLDKPSPGKAAPKAPKTEVPAATGRPTVTHNTERDGVELRFNGKPDDATRLAMKANGFRWLPGQPGQPWAAKYSEEVWLFAQSLATGDAYTPMPEPAETPAPQPVAETPAKTPEGWGRAYVFPSGLATPPAATPPAPTSRVRNIILPDF